MLSPRQSPWQECHKKTYKAIQAKNYQEAKVIIDNGEANDILKNKWFFLSTIENASYAQDGYFNPMTWSIIGMAIKNSDVEILEWVKEQLSGEDQGKWKTAELGSYRTEKFSAMQIAVQYADINTVAFLVEKCGCACIHNMTPGSDDQKAVEISSNQPSLFQMACSRGGSKERAIVYYLAGIDLNDSDPNGDFQAALRYGSTVALALLLNRLKESEKLGEIQLNATQLEDDVLLTLAFFGIVKSHEIQWDEYQTEYSLTFFPSSASASFEPTQQYFTPSMAQNGLQLMQYLCSILKQSQQITGRRTPPLTVDAEFEFRREVSVEVLKSTLVGIVDKFEEEIDWIRREKGEEEFDILRVTALSKKTEVVSFSELNPTVRVRKLQKSVHRHLEGSAELEEDEKQTQESLIVTVPPDQINKRLGQMNRLLPSDSVSSFFAAYDRWRDNGGDEQAVDAYLSRLNEEIEKTKSRLDEMDHKKAEAIQALDTWWDDMELAIQECSDVASDVLEKYQYYQRKVFEIKDKSDSDNYKVFWTKKNGMKEMETMCNNFSASLEKMQGDFRIVETMKSGLSEKVSDGMKEVEQGCFEWSATELAIWLAHCKWPKYKGSEDEFKRVFVRQNFDGNSLKRISEEREYFELGGVLGLCATLGGDFQKTKELRGEVEALFQRIDNDEGNPTAGTGPMF